MRTVAIFVREDPLLTRTFGPWFAQQSQNRTNAVRQVEETDVSTVITRTTCRYEVESSTDSPSSAARIAASPQHVAISTDNGIIFGVEVPCRADDPDLWFAESPHELERAKELCVECPIRRMCLSAALDRAEPWGVWGGEILDQGVVIARKRPRGRPRKDRSNQLEVA